MGPRPVLLVLILLWGSNVWADEATSIQSPAPAETAAPTNPAPAAPPVNTETAIRHYQTGLAYERLGRLDEAYTELQLASALKADDPLMSLALGIVSLRQGHDAAGQRALEQSVAQEADSISTYYELALLYEKIKATDRATDSWHRFLDLNTDPLLNEQGHRHLQRLETGSDTPNAEPEKSRRLIVVLGHAKVLGPENQILEKTNPILTNADRILPSGPGGHLSRMVAYSMLKSPTK